MRPENRKGFSCGFSAYLLLEEAKAEKIFADVAADGRTIRKRSGRFGKLIKRLAGRSAKAIKRADKAIRSKAGNASLSNFCR